MNVVSIYDRVAVFALFVYWSIYPISKHRNLSGLLHLEWMMELVEYRADPIIIGKVLF